jgi:hypothetical protein
MKPYTQADLDENNRKYDENFIRIQKSKKNSKKFFRLKRKEEILNNEGVEIAKSLNIYSMQLGEDIRKPVSLSKQKEHRIIKAGLSLKELKRLRRLKKGRAQEFTLGLKRPRDISDYNQVARENRNGHRKNY